MSPGVIRFKNLKDNECMNNMMIKAKIQWAKRKKERRRNPIFLSLCMSQINNRFEKRTTTSV